MGIDLQVMASYFRERRGELLPTATLRFERDPELFSKFSKDSIPCLVQPLPGDLKVGVYADTGLAFKDQDSYGYPLTFISSLDLAQLEFSENLSVWNAAVLTFMGNLPADARIVLYWC